MYRVTIGIQARTNNQRLPGKCLMDINGRVMLDRVIDAASGAARHITKNRYGMHVTVCLLVPTNDPLKSRYEDYSNLKVVEGPEEDVLTRYMIGLEETKADFMCRITSDCPLIPSPLISKHIICATRFEMDYISNVNEKVRVAPDGYDCEVISADLLKWADKTAVSKEDREHVTTIIRRATPQWAKDGNVISPLNLSHLKLSVDTEEDLFFVREYDKLLKEKIDLAKNKNFADAYFFYG